MLPPVAPDQLVRPATLTEAVIAHLSDAIVHGTYPPGSPLPEATLARSLGTSRGTVREALRALDELGLVEVIPHRGAAVARMTTRGAREVYDLRLALEGFCARDTIERRLITPRARGTIERALADVVAAADGGVFELVDAERGLHAAIASVNDNELLRNQLSAIDHRTRHFLLYYRPDRLDPDAEVAEHRILVAGLLSGDGDRAERVAREHVRHARDLVIANMTASDASPDSRMRSQPSASPG